MAQSLRESPRLSKPQAEPTTNVLSHVLACMWRREIGGLFEVRCCVRSGASLLAGACAGHDWSCTDRASTA